MFGAEVEYGDMGRALALERGRGEVSDAASAVAPATELGRQAKEQLDVPTNLKFRDPDRRF